MKSWQLCNVSVKHVDVFVGAALVFNHNFTFETLSESIFCTLSRNKRWCDLPCTFLGNERHVHLAHLIFRKNRFPLLKLLINFAMVNLTEEIIPVALLLLRRLETMSPTVRKVVIVAVVSRNEKHFSQSTVFKIKLKLSLKTFWGNAQLACSNMCKLQATEEDNDREIQ